MVLLQTTLLVLLQTTLQKTLFLLLWSILIKQWIIIKVTTIFIDNIIIFRSIRNKLKDAGYAARDDGYAKKYTTSGKYRILTVTWGEAHNSSLIDPLYIKVLPKKVKTLFTAKETAKLLIKKADDKLETENQEAALINTRSTDDNSEILEILEIVHCDVENKM